MKIIRIATRKSRLALWQAEHVAERLRRAHVGLETELVPLSTRGDEIQDRPLAAIGGKGLFLKELERALLDGRADVAAHSMKDVPAELEAGFCLAAVLPRGNPFDAFVSNNYRRFDELPEGARLGTSSLRRQCLAKALRPDLDVRSLRGNVQTRLGKLDDGQFDAILLAAAGLERLGLDNRVRARLGPPDWLPAAGQGAVGVECLEDAAQVRELLGALDDAETACTVGAERAVVARLEGSCQVPIGAFARLDRDRLHLQAMVGRPDGSEVIRGRRVCDPGDAAAAGDELGLELLERGGGKILSDLVAMHEPAAG